MGHETIPQHILERFLLGELPKSRIENIKNQIESDPELKHRLETLQSSNREILDEYPPHLISSQIANRSEATEEPVDRKQKSPFGLLRSLMYISPVLVTSVLVIFVALPLIKNFQPGTNRTKGSTIVSPDTPHLIIHRQTNDKIEVLKNAQTVSPGDLLQIAYVSRQKPFGMILSIDGNGTVTLHFPYNPTDPTILDKNNRIFLANSYELDDAPDFERFFFITSDHEFNVRKVVKMAEELGQQPEKARTERLQLEDSIQQYSILLIKKIQIPMK